jgi:ATP-dependent DNA helicase RecG
MHADTPVFLVPPADQLLDGYPIQRTSVDDIDLERVSTHVASAVSRGKLPKLLSAVDYLLQRKGVVQIGDRIYATMAGILCFGKAPQQFFPNAVVDIAHFRGTNTVAFDVINLKKGIGGTLFDQLEYCETYIWNNTHHGMTLSPDSLQRIERHQYPRAVVRELVVNMVTHRDYMIYGSPARIQLFRDRIEWSNPGGLLEGVAVADLLSVQLARNPLLLAILDDAGYVEGVGQGLDTVVSVLQQEGMRLPHFDDKGLFFIATVYGLDANDDEETPARLPVEALSETQQRLLAVLRRSRRPLASSEITEELDERGRRTVIRDLNQLIELGYVRAQGRARATRYTLSEGA